MATRGQQGLPHLVQSGSLDALRAALGPSAKRWINVDQQTLLFFAVLRKADCKEVCELLIDVHGVDPNAEDKRGQTALHYLAKTGHVSCVDLLISRGCSVDHVDENHYQTPLFYAARWSTRLMVKCLVDHKADVNFKDSSQQTPLFYARSLEVCEELLRGRGDACLAIDTHGVTVAESHWQRQQYELADFLATCAEALSHTGRMTWAVQRAAASPGVAGARGGASGAYGNWEAYATSVARGRDVKQLCQLEDEFVEDHRRVLGSEVPDAEFWSQIGLSPDAAKRRSTIQSITQVTKGSGKRHYTLKCLHLPPNPQRQAGPPRLRACRVAGYVYFKICEGDRDREESAGTRGARAAGAELAGAQSTRAHIVVSHLKVNAEHQRRGVATLLLAGMLQLVETEHGGFDLSHLYLSVVAENASAAALYRKLGFVETYRDGETVEWLHMKLVLAAGCEGAPTSAATRDAWLHRVRGTSGSLASDGVQPKQQQTKRKQVQVSSRLSRRRLEVKTPTSAGASALSTVSSTSAGGTTMVSGSSLESARRANYPTLSY
ncbi:unnamed protein product [Prorocentrum cordatum]|uniref:N-acetyltransferase domain-containing protein n=1 Tax=Prorocentrum cordatum TaxID=2364126 RepID=A0ABN9VZF0_9DINO|nr:unnamed protein product [Polarella glacialis]